MALVVALFKKLFRLEAKKQYAFGPDDPIEDPWSLV